MPRPEELLFPSRKERFEDRRREGEHRKLREEFFDHATLLAISHLITQGQFETLDHPIAVGKEGGVFRATSPEGYRAVKIYRIGNSVFRSLPPYVLAELRHAAGDRNFRRLISAWTRREHSMLRRMREAEVRVPTPYAYFRNVLVMEFIGIGGVAAARLTESTPKDPEALCEELGAQVRRMVTSAHLVHGDLSPYNVLLQAEAPVFIDVASALPSTHPQARGLLERDLRNFSLYFERLGARTSFEELWEAAGGATLPVAEG